ncbi:MAG: AAA family ATPase [Crenarchaeota archaeon]|nr:AAA family ATPase [Thermoproteota archaeon]
MGVKIPRTIIITAGLPGAGKGTFASIAKELGIPVIVMGDIVREEAKRRGLEPTSENLRAVARDLREKGGQAIIAKMVIDIIMKKYKDACVVLVDGCRTPEELEAFKKVAKVIVVGIEAPFEIRLARLAARGREDDLGDVERLLRARDASELALGIDKVMEQADIIINNAGSLEDFVNKAKKILKEIIEESCR